VFEKHKVTSAVPAAFLLLLPLNITSAICPLRRLFTLCSPSTHFTASTTLLLPQPFGPTMHVIEELKPNSVLSAKLLNPSRTIFSSLIFSSDVNPYFKYCPHSDFKEAHKLLSADIFRFLDY
jgi:hypothetical protein